MTRHYGLCVLYLCCAKHFPVCGRRIEPVALDPDGVTAEEAFIAFDRYGTSIPCRQPNRLARILRGKAGLNFQIQQWAEGILDGVFCLPEFQESYPWLPEWVWDAVRGQTGPFPAPFEWHYADVLHRKRQEIAP